MKLNSLSAIILSISLTLILSTEVIQPSGLVERSLTSTIAMISSGGKVGEKVGGKAGGKAVISDVEKEEKSKEKEKEKDSDSSSPSFHIHHHEHEHEVFHTHKKLTNNERNKRISQRQLKAEKDKKKKKQSSDENLELHQHKHIHEVIHYHPDVKKTTDKSKRSILSRMNNINGKRPHSSSSILTTTSSSSNDKLSTDRERLVLNRHLLQNKAESSSSSDSDIKQHFHAHKHKHIVHHIHNKIDKKTRKLTQEQNNKKGNIKLEDKKRKIINANTLADNSLKLRFQNQKKSLLNLVGKPQSNNLNRKLNEEYLNRKLSEDSSDATKYHIHEHSHIVQHRQGKTEDLDSFAGFRHGFPAFSHAMNRYSGHRGRLSRHGFAVGNPF